MVNIVTKHQPITEAFLHEGAMILVDKPLEWTSFDVVNKLRYKIRKYLEVKKFKVGHAGTLDPLATGLLIICIGRYTKQIDTIVAQQKGYKGQVTLGADTPSLDRETLPHVYYPNKEITADDIKAVKAEFSGIISQLPPMYSAIKVNGQALYHSARKGVEIKRQPREVNIHDLQIEKSSETTLEIDVSCSKGTYIRTLANDIGQFLKTGGHLSGLRRTLIGDYSVEDAITIDEFLEQMDHLPKQIAD